MLAEEVYKVWAPVGAKWVEWVRPVPFIGLNEKLKLYGTGVLTMPTTSYIQHLFYEQSELTELNESSNQRPFTELAELSNCEKLKENNINKLNEQNKTKKLDKQNKQNKFNKDETAVIIDLPGIESIKEGLTVAQIGFRPIPIYNGTDEQLGAMPTVDNTSIKIGLLKGALELKKMKIEETAPPAFLLDSNRMNRYKMNESVFDNSWDVYAQDMPSAEYFLNNGINKIIIIAKKLNKDLQKILYNYQNKKIEIYLASEYDNIKKIKVKKGRKIDDDF